MPKKTQAVQILNKNELDKGSAKFLCQIVRTPDVTHTQPQNKART